MDKATTMTAAPAPPPAKAPAPPAAPTPLPLIELVGKWVRCPESGCDRAAKVEAGRNFAGPRLVLLGCEVHGVHPHDERARAIPCEAPARSSLYDHTCP
jgi:hypothetical protein